MKVEATKAKLDGLTSIEQCYVARKFVSVVLVVGDAMVEEICRNMGISDATFYKWRQKYGGLGPSELRKPRQLEEENRKLERLLADVSLDKAMLQAVLSKKR